MMEAVGESSIWSLTMAHKPNLSHDVFVPQKVADDIMAQVGFMIRHVGRGVVEGCTQQILDVFMFTNHVTNLTIFCFSSESPNL